MYMKAKFYSEDIGVMVVFGHENTTHTRMDDGIY
jgi:hypothetical protein